MARGLLTIQQDVYPAIFVQAIETACRYYFWLGCDERERGPEFTRRGASEILAALCFVDDRVPYDGILKILDDYERRFEGEAKILMRTLGKQLRERKKELERIARGE